MLQRAVGRRHVAVHGVPDERVDERERKLVREDLPTAERVEGRGRLLLGQSRQLGDGRELGLLAEHRDRARDGRDRRRHAPQAQHHQGRDGARADGAHGVDMGHVRSHALFLERAQELAQQQGVAGGHPVAGTHEGVRGFAQELVDQQFRRPRPTAGGAGAP